MLFLRLYSLYKPVFVSWLILTCCTPGCPLSHVSGICDKTGVVVVLVLVLVVYDIVHNDDSFVEEDYE